MTPKARRAYIDPDFRSYAKLSSWDSLCYRCAKPLTSRKYRLIHVVDGGMNCVHPEDEEQYAGENDTGDCGFHPVGMNCAKKIGLEYTIREQSNDQII